MGACASILKHNETVAEAKKKARESFKNSNESWVYAQTKKKKDFVQNLNKQKSGSKVDFDAIPEDEEVSLSDMNAMRLELGEETALEQHGTYFFIGFPTHVSSIKSTFIYFVYLRNARTTDHELLGESEDLCKDDVSFTQPSRRSSRSLRR